LMVIQQTIYFKHFHFGDDVDGIDISSNHSFVIFDNRF